MVSEIVPLNSRRGRPWTRVLVPVTAAIVLSQVMTPWAGADELSDERIATIVDAVIKARDAAVVEPGVAPRAPVLTAGTVIAGIAVTAELSTTEGHQRAALRDLREAVAAAGTSFDEASTRTTTKSVVRNGDRITAIVNDRSRFRIAQRERATPTAEDFHLLSVDRRVEFVRSGAGWRMTGIRLTNQTGSTPTNEAAPRRPRRPDAAPAPRPTSRTTTATGEADRKAVAAYARRYWEDYNPEYRDYDERGGDCTNFVSQAMRAGGWRDVAGPWGDHKAWWHHPGNESHSWISVEKWYGFTRDSGRTRLGEVHELRVGDILQVDFQNNGRRDHSMVVTRTRDGEKYLTYHSDDEYNKPLSVIEEQNPDAVFTAHLV